MIDHAILPSSHVNWRRLADPVGKSRPQSDSQAPLYEEQVSFQPLVSNQLKRSKISKLGSGVKRGWKVHQHLICCHLEGCAEAGVGAEEGSGSC